MIKSMQVNPITHIESSRDSVSETLQELWRYRDLLVKMTWRTLKIRYKQTYIGMLWAVAQPFLLMLVYSVVFSVILRNRGGNEPYPLFVFTNLTIFAVFSDGLTKTVTSIVSGSSLYQKIYFPRAIIPISTALTVLFDHLLAVGVVFILILYYGYPLRLSMLLFPVFSVLTLSLALGVGFTLGSINIWYRDIQNLIPLLIRVLMFTLPIVYPITLIGGQLRQYLMLNPIYSYIEGYAWALLGREYHAPYMLVSALVFTIISFFVGLWIFTRSQSQFAEIV